MTCSQCRHEFCWICMGDWSIHGSSTGVLLFISLIFHSSYFFLFNFFFLRLSFFFIISGGYYQCNRPVDLSAQQKKQSEAKKRVDYFNHYQARFDNHDNSLKFAKKEHKNVGEKMAAYRRLHNCDQRVAEFLEKGTALVVDCRRILKYTYVYGFFMADGSSKTLFVSELEGVSCFG